MSEDKTILIEDQNRGGRRGQTSNYDAVEEIGGDTENIVVITNERPKKIGQHIAGLSATLSALAAGTILGWTSPILSQIQNGAFNNITVNDNEMGWIGSVVTLGALTTCVPAGFICEIIGSKMTLLFTVIPYSLGWSLIVFAKSIFMLYFGRFITGMASGACCVAAPLYCSEIASSDIRGAIGTYFQLMVTVGILTAYVSGKFLAPIPYTIFCGCVPLLFFIVFVFQPESPVFVIKKGLYERAVISLKRLRGVEYDHRAELAQIENSIKESQQTSVSIRQTFRRRACRKAFIIACALMFLQQFSGVNAIIVYTSDIFHSSGVKLDANTATIIVGIFQVVATFCSSLVIDRLGRKILLMISSIVMAISTVSLAIFYTLKNRTTIDPTTLNTYGFAPVLLVCLFIIVFSLGLGPIPWLISAEIFTDDIKSIASSAAISLNWFLAFIITKFYLQVNNAVGQDSTFYFFSVCSFSGALFVYYIIPETGGKSIEQIQEELES